LNTVLHTFATRDHEFSDGLDKLSQLVDGLAQRKNDISTGLAYINAAAASVSDLLVQSRQPIKEVVRETDRVSAQVLADRDYVDKLLKDLPDVYQVLARQGLNGDYFGFYFCDVLMKINGKGGNPVFIKLLSQPSGRCTPQ
jgi:phospholipid/cholesterol/gamma-HCH transport system substrate-binding protein